MIILPDNQRNKLLNESLFFDSHFWDQLRLWNFGWIFLPFKFRSSDFYFRDKLPAHFGDVRKILPETPRGNNLCCFHLDFQFSRVLKLLIRKPFCDLFSGTKKGLSEPLDFDSHSDWLYHFSDLDALCY